MLDIEMDEADRLLGVLSGFQSGDACKLQELIHIIEILHPDMEFGHPIQKIDIDILRRYRDMARRMEATHESL